MLILSTNIRVRHLQTMTQNLLAKIGIIATDRAGDLDLSLRAPDEFWKNYLTNCVVLDLAHRSLPHFKAPLH